MSTHGPFGGWYCSHLGEPLEADHVTGYWTFLLGALLALLGLVCFLVASTFERGAENFWLFRRVAFTLALVAGPLLVLSVVYLLPLQSRAVWLALGGLLLCVGAAVAFNVFYPDDWNWGTADRSGLIMAGYGLGIGLQILTVFLYPIVSAETAQPEAGGDDAAAVGASDSEPAGSEATFQLYEDRGGEHRWRLVHDDGNLIADGGEGYASRQKARQGMEGVRKNAPGADEAVLESPPADAPAVPADESASETDDAGAVDSGEAPSTDAEEPHSTAAADAAEESEFEFGATEPAPRSDAEIEVYEDAAGKWRWRLRHRNGNVVADSGQGYADRDGVDEAVERLQSVVADADTLEYDPAAYEVYADEADEWRWRLRYRNGRILGDSGEGYASRHNAREAVDRVRERAADEANFEVYEDAEDEYRWRLVAGNGEVVADSGQGYTRERDAEEAVERTTTVAPDADTLDYEPAAFEVYQDRAEEWRWRLRHRNGNVLADSGEGYSSKQKARQGLRSVVSNAPDAEVSDSGA